MACQSFAIEEAPVSLWISIFTVHPTSPSVQVQEGTRTVKLLESDDMPNCAPSRVIGHRRNFKPKATINYNVQL